MKKLIAWCVNKFRFYVVFTKAILFTLGLVFSCKVVKDTLFINLITRLTDDEWKHPNLAKAATVVNLHEGTYALVQILFAFVADAYSGLFKMLVCSVTLYIIGLWLFWVAARNEGFLDFRIFYSALVIVTLSQAALKVTLESFLCDQLLTSTEEEEEEEERGCSRRTKFWWNCVSVLALIVVFFGTSRIDSFKLLAKVSAIGMGAGFLWFLLGIKFYHCAKPTGISSLTAVVYVIHTALAKRNLVEYPQFPEHLYQNSSGLVQIVPHVPWLRWLDRAAVVVQPAAGQVWSVEQVQEVKFLLKMLPMWTTFIVFSLVAATGSTFFLQEAAEEDLPILVLIILQRFTAFVVAAISDYGLEKLIRTRKKINNNNIVGQRVMLVRIGIGMICCFLCCVAAWIHALHWLHLVKIYKDKAQEHTGIFRVIPQFFLMGAMEGLSEDGLGNFFDSQVSKSTARYGPHFGACVEGISKFLSAVCILILSSKSIKWFKADVNSSHLDRYYALLAILSFANMIMYWMVAYWYGDERFLSEDDDDDDDVDLENGESVQALQEEEEDSIGLVSSQSALFNRRYKSFQGPRILSTQQDSSYDDDGSSAGQKVSDLVSESAMNDDAPMLLSGVRSFPDPSSRRLHKRFLSMR